MEQQTPRDDTSFTAMDRFAQAVIAFLVGATLAGPLADIGVPWSVRITALLITSFVVFRMMSRVCATPRALGLAAYAFFVPIALIGMVLRAADLSAEAASLTAGLVADAAFFAACAYFRRASTAVAGNKRMARRPVNRNS